MPGIRISGRDPTQGANLAGGFDYGSSLNPYENTATAASSNGWSPMGQWAAQHAANVRNITTIGVAGFSLGGSTHTNTYDWSSMGQWASKQHAANARNFTAAGVAGFSGGPGNVNGFRNQVGAFTDPLANLSSSLTSAFVTAFGTNVNRASPGSIAGLLGNILVTDQRLATAIGGAAGFANGGGVLVGGGEINIPPPPVPVNGAWKYAGGGPNAGINIPRPPAGWGGGGPGPGGGGGGGGGSSGSGGNAGGWSGRGGLPFAGMVGLGTSSRLLTTGLGTGIAAELIEELVTLPQHALGAEGSFMSASNRFRDWQADVFSMGRAGGFSGQMLMNRIMPGSDRGALDSMTGLRAPAWRARYGLGPEEATQLYSNFGIVQSSDAASQALIESLASMRFDPAMSGLNMTGSARQMAKYGVVSPDAAGVQSYMKQMSPILTEAVALGFDRSSRAESIDTGIRASLQGGGIGASIGGFGSFMSQFNALPGGRTGEVALDSAHAFSAATQTVGSDPLRTQVFIRAAAGIRTEADLKNLVNRGDDGYFDRLTANSATRKLVTDFMAAKAKGDDAQAGWLLAQILEGGGRGGVPGNSAAEQYLYSNDPSVQQLPDYYKSRVGLGNQSPAEINAYRVAAGDRANNPLNLMSGPGGTLGRYTSMQEGIAADVRQLFINRDTHGLTTLQQQINRWAPASAGNNTTAYAARVAKRLGIGVNDTLNLNDPEFVQRLVQSMAQEEVGHTLPGQTVAEGVGLAMHRNVSMPNVGFQTDTYPGEPSLSGGSRIGGGNMQSPETLQNRADALSAAMVSSETSFREFNTVLGKYNDTIIKLAKTLSDAISDFRRQSNDPLNWRFMNP